MNNLLQEIFDSGKVNDGKGNSYDLHSHTNPEQCLFLQELVQMIKPRRSLEIGLAYGISTLALLEALSKNPEGFHHTVIDPFQSRYWHNVGFEYIKRTGYSDHVSFHERFSYEFLPELVRQKERVQFVYIDTTKVFDLLIVDTFFINQLLDVNGIMVFDDCAYPGIRQLVRFFAVHPSFKVLKGFGKDQTTAKRRMATSLNYGIMKALPFKEKTLPGHNFSTDKELNVDYGCVAFQKISEDNRNWDWFQSF